MTTKLVYNAVSGYFDLVTASLTPGEITGGSPNTFAGFDGSGNLESLPNWSVDSNTTGASFNANLTPADPNADWAINAFNTTIVPTVDLTQLSFEGLRNSVALQGPNDHYNTTVFNNGIQTSGTGAHGDIKVINSDIGLGDGTNVSTSGNFNYINANIVVNASHAANNLTGVNFHCQVDGDVTSNISLFNIQSDLNSSLSAGSGISGMLIGGNLHGTVDFYSGLQVGPNFQSGASVTTGTQVISDNTHVYSGATLNNLTVFSVDALVDSGATITGGFSGLSLNPILNGSMTGTGANMINGGGQTSAAMDYYNGVIMGPQFNSGTAIVDGYNGFQSTPHMFSGSSADSMTEFTADAVIDSGATLTSYRGLQINPQLNSNISNLNLASLFANGSGTHTNVTGLNIDLSAVTSTNRRQGININGGTINFNSINTTGSSLGVDGANFIVPSLTVTAPVTGTSFIANNFSSMLDIQDDFATGAIPGIGIAGIGFVGQMQVSSGKTLDAVSWAMAGAQVGGAGTITDYNCYHALGAIPTGTTTITNMYGFRANQFLNGATNVWGISIEEATAENYFEKSLAIGTTSHKVTSSGTGLEIKTKDLVIDGGDQYITAMSANGVITNDTSGKLISVAPGTAGNVLTSSGGVWISAPNGASATTVAASAYISVSSVTFPSQPINYDVVTIDTHSAITTGTNWQYLVPITGTYRLSASQFAQASSQKLYAYVNGTITDVFLGKLDNNVYSGSGLILLNVNDVLDFRTDTTGLTVSSIGPGTCRIDINLV